MTAPQQPLVDGVAGVLREAVDGRFTGSVGIAGQGVGGTVHLDDGRIYWAALAGDAEVAGIVSRLPVNSITLARIRWHMANGLSLADALTRIDDCDHAGVRNAIRSLAEAALTELLAVEEGRFHTVPDARSPIGVLATLDLPRPARPPADPKPPVPAGPVWLLAPAPGPVELDETEWRVVAALGAPQSAEVLAARTGLPLEAVLAAVERLRRRRLAAAPAAEQRPPAPRPSRGAPEAPGRRAGGTLQRLIAAARDS
ncbi:MAG TPA: DUF4388 domain-containing protein [Acidimicrobiales bacterium]|nr:DUF4388 domain-containing protein [Acidimicrobiales bacterium]